MRDKAGQSGKYTPECSAGHIRLSGFLTITGAEPRVETEKDTNQADQHSYECRRQVRTEHPSDADAENRGGSQDREIAWGKMAAVKIQPEHIADDIDRKQKRSSSDG